MPGTVAKVYLITTGQRWLGFRTSVGTVAQAIEIAQTPVSDSPHGDGFLSWVAPVSKGATGLVRTRSIMRQSKAMASQRKPVIVRRFSRDWIPGYAPSAFPSESPELEILDTAGKVLRLGWATVKWVCYVRDLAVSSADRDNPERLIHKRFTVRPRTAGLWLRMTLQDGEELEGLAPNDRSLIDGAGLLLTPPDQRSNTQRIFVPRSAIQVLEVVSLIGAARRRPAEAPQAELFDDPEG